MKLFIYIVISIVALAVIAAFFVAGSPAKERLRKFDDQRASDLQNIQYWIVAYWQSKGQLPAVLSDLNDSLRGIAVPKDPETSADYGYSANGPLSFSVCANFHYSNENSQTKAAYPVAAPYLADGVSQNWQHGAGYVCFDRTIDKDFYKQYPPVKY